MSERNDIRIDVVGDADSFEASTRGAASELDAVKRQILDMAAKAQGATGATRSLGVEQERLAAAARAFGWRQSWDTASFRPAPPLRPSSLPKGRPC